MKRVIDYPIIGSSYPERSPELDVQKTVNWYVVYDPKGVKPMAFAPTPGTILLKILNSSSNPVRQIYSYKNIGLIFAGSLVYRFDQDLDVSFVGTIASTSGFISVSNSTTQFFITDGKNGYVYTIATGVLAKITDPNFEPDPLMGVYFSDYFVSCKTDSNEWQVSDVNDATDWTVLDAPNAATISVKADTFQGLGVVNQRLFLFGNYITEVWYPGVNPAYPQFPYSRDNNSVFEYGCASTASIANGDKKDDGVLFWLSSTKNGVGSVMMTDGGKPRRVSTPAVDLQIQKYSTVNDAIGFSYNQDGYVFYQLTFPTQNVTWLCNFSILDEQGYPSWTNLELINYNCHMATCHTYFAAQNKHLIGSNQGPRLLQLSTNTYVNDRVAPDGSSIKENIRSTRIGQTFSLPSYNRFVIYEFQADFEGGVGKSNDPEEVPAAFLSNSYDGGHTFTHVRKEEVGRMGQYKYRANWYGLGVTRTFIPKLEVFGGFRKYLMGSSLTINECSN